MNKPKFVETWTDKEKKLYDIAPEFFDVPENWPIQFGFSHGAGWEPLVTTLIEFIAYKAKRWQEVADIKEKAIKDGEDYTQWSDDWITKYLEENSTDPMKNFRIMQVKEKMGGLRFYVTGLPYASNVGREVAGAIEFASNMSYSTCEFCGATQNVTTEGPGWIRSLCKPCRAKTDIKK